MQYIRTAVAALALAASATTAFAGDFVDVLNTGARTPGSTNNINTDPFYLAGIPAAWTQLASQTSAVSFDVYNRERTELIGNFTVGTLIDTVWKDDATNSLIFGTYFQLDNNTNGITEINSIVRSGFAEFDTVAAAWTFADSVYDGVAGGYRLRDPSRSDYVATYNATAAGNGDYLDLDKVAIRTDVSLAEGNPNSGLYLLRVDATGYTYAMSDDVVRIVQGASSSEGGRIFQDTHLAGYVAVPVPEPSEYALMLIGLAGVGFSVRRRQQRR